MEKPWETLWLLRSGRHTYQSEELTLIRGNVAPFFGSQFELILQTA